MECSERENNIWEEGNAKEGDLCEKILKKIESNKSNEGNYYWEEKNKWIEKFKTVEENYLR